MKTLILLRHSYAEKNGNKKDFDRNLTEKGIRVARFMSHEIKKHIPKIDLIVSSSALRSKETGKIFKSTINPNIPIYIEKDLYYLQFSNLFYDLVYELDESFQTVLFIGHNPIFTFLAQSLANNSNIYFYPGSFLIVHFPVNNWTEVNQGTAQDSIFVSSKNIQEQNP